MHNGILWDRDKLTLKVPPVLKRIYSVAYIVKRISGSRRYALRPDIMFTYVRDRKNLLSTLGRVSQL